MKRNYLHSAVFMLLLVLGGFLLPTTGAAATNPLVSTDWLAKNL